MHHVRTKTVKTRKPATCWGCRRTFPKGTTIEKHTSVDLGRISTTAWCATCIEMIVAFYVFHGDEGHGWSQGCMVDDERAGFLDFIYETEFWPS